MTQILFRAGTSCLLFVFVASCLQAAPIAVVPPSEVGMRDGMGSDIDLQVESAIDEGKLSGCVVVIGRHGQVVHRRAYGHRSVEPSLETMTVDTVFDLASLTKPLATSTCIMQLVERGGLKLDHRVSKYFPEYAARGKQGTTIEQLLLHTAGLIPDNPLDDYMSGRKTAVNRICKLAPISQPGTRFKYSDVGYVLLGELIAKLTGQPLDVFASQNVFEPLGMTETGFNPAGDLRQRIAPTEVVEDEWLRGVVHDPRARALSGVAGHAGLFGTADDLTRFAQMVLGRGAIEGRRVLSPSTVAEWLRPRAAGKHLRSAGWDVASSYSRSRGEMMSPQAVGHGGFTGTAMWIDPQLDLFVIFLSSRLHPDGKGSVNDLVGRIGTIASSACVGEASEDVGQSPSRTVTRLGIEVLSDQGFALLRNQRVGLIANHTSCSSARESTAKLLREAADVDLVALFSPEHGINGIKDTTNIADSTDLLTKLPVYSLYGKTRQPLPEQLKNIDVMVMDVQDIGCRFYTYVSTMGLAMEACSRHGVAFVVLDRPNPLGGSIVEGPVLDAGLESFVGFHTLPVRHGMTMGELATMFAAERELDLQLNVVEMNDWHRSDYLFDTGLPWVNTSPNMRSLTQALLYPGIGLFEMTNVSVGRGTDTPFELIGAPWIDELQLARCIERHQLLGVRTVPIRFTPSSSTHTGEECGGVNLVITDWNAFRPLRMAWVLANSLRDLYPDAWDTSRMTTLLGNQDVYQRIISGESPQKIRSSYQPELEEFIKRRKAYLLY